METKFYAIDFLNGNDDVVRIFLDGATKLGMQMEKFHASTNADAYIPIFFCHSYDKLIEQGVRCPREFVVEDQDFYWECGAPGITRIRKRLVWLKLQCNILSINDVVLKDWFSGLFRRYCFQDEHVHGTNSLLNLSSADNHSICKRWFGVEINDADDDVKRFQQRFGKLDSKFYAGEDSLEPFKPFIKGLFKDSYDTIAKAIDDFRKSYERKGTEHEVYYNNACIGCINAIKESLPINKASTVRFEFPTLKANVLVVDDNAIEEVRKLNADKRLNQIFKFDAVDNLKAEDDKGIVEKAIEQFKALRKSGRTYDFVLLDLCLAEAAGSDLSGYHLIKILQQFFPQMPIIIYSQFGDMGHIERAFRCGAKWFLKKDEVQKLPRHIMSIVQKIDWQKEWRMINRNELVVWDEEQSKGFVEIFPKLVKEARQYLTYKCLEKYPGKTICVKKMGGGLSDAVTFSAVKGKCQNGEYLQTPVIIKIDKHYNTMGEYERYFRFIRPYIANESGRVEVPAIFLDRDTSAIVYTYAGKQDNAHELRDMKSMLTKDVMARSTCNYEKYRSTLDELFDDILPKIHNVDPANEVEGTDIGNAPSSFPNPFFGEFFSDNYGVDLFANHLCRISVNEPIKDATLINQPGYSEDPPQWPTCCYEFHGVNESTGGGKCSIECYDHDTKCTVLLTGDKMDHVVRYRRHIIPGTTLWVDKDKGALQLDDSLNGKLVDAWKSSKGVAKTTGAIEDIWYYLRFAELIRQLTYGDVRNPNRGLQSALDSLGIKALDHEKTEPFKVVLEFVKYIKSQFANVGKSGWTENRFRCKLGIVHGDLNMANIMLDSLKHPPKENDPDVTSTIRDAWLIDFARTRRDYIAHDFNVLFTSIVVALFHNDIWESAEYRDSLRKVFPQFIHDVVVGERDAVPDYIEGDKRFEMIFKMLRRIRKAALKDDKMTQDAYTLTTAMACMVAFKLYLNKKNACVQAAAGLIAIALLCLSEL